MRVQSNFCLRKLATYEGHSSPLLTCLYININDGIMRLGSDRTHYHCLPPHLRFQIWFVFSHKAAAAQRALKIGVHQPTQGFRCIDNIKRSAFLIHVLFAGKPPPSVPMISWMRVRSTSLNELLNLRLVKEYGFNRFVCTYTLITWINIREEKDIGTRCQVQQRRGSVVRIFWYQFRICDCRQSVRVRDDVKQIQATSWKQFFTIRPSNPTTVSISLGRGGLEHALFDFENGLHVTKMLLKKLLDPHLLWSIGLPILIFSTKFPLWMNLQLPSSTGTLPVAAREY